MHEKLCCKTSLHRPRPMDSSGKPETTASTGVDKAFFPSSACSLEASPWTIRMPGNLRNSSLHKFASRSTTSSLDSGKPVSSNARVMAPVPAPNSTTIPLRGITCFAMVRASDRLLGTAAPIFKGARIQDVRKI